MSKYGGPATPEMIEAAVTRALEQLRAAPEVSLDDHINNAVTQTVNACVLEIEDELQPHQSGTYAQVLQDVRLQVRLRLLDQLQDPKKDPVDVASDESFPASDPPGWIWERPGR